MVGWLRLEKGTCILVLYACMLVLVGECRMRFKLINIMIIRFFPQAMLTIFGMVTLLPDCEVYDEICMVRDLSEDR